MKKKLLTLAFFAAASLYANNTNTQTNGVDYKLQLLNSVIPNTKIAKYEQSEIQGFYKVYVENGQIFYVNPFNNLLIFGEIWTNKGFSLTQNDVSAWRNELLKSSISELEKNYKVSDLTSVAKKLTYGKGSKKYEFLMFTDPECPYCKTAEEYFEKQDVDLHIVFKPLDFHKNAKDWSLKALSSKNLKQALIDLKQGKIPEVEITEKAKNELMKMEELSTKLKVDGTPKIIVIDKLQNKVIDTIEGANIPKIEEYLKERK